MRKKRGSLLQKRLYMLSLVCLIPLIVMILYLLFLINRFSNRYDEVADNFSVANAYSINFKEKMDYTMYIIVVNRGRVEGITGTEPPHIMIQKARQDFWSLYRHADSEYAKSQISGILKCLNTLDDRVKEIEEDVLVSGAYDKNMERLDLNIRVLTELIQERIQEYIHFETSQLDGLREGIRTDVRTALRTSVFVFTAILFGVVMFSRKIMISITEPVRRLSAVTKLAGSGDFDVRAQEDSGDELAVLNANFNQMVEKIGQLVEHIRLEQITLRQTELKVLQAQINPHFLYNTLDAIAWCCEEERHKDAVEMVNALAKLFRISISKGHELITIEKELQHAQSYLKIQKFRYKNQFVYSFDVYEECLPYLCNKITLQPIIENAIYHGLDRMVDEGEIRIRIYPDGDDIVFTVSDNGVGMTPEQCQEILQDESGEKTGIGIKNVNDRIKIYFGENYGLTIESELDEGTTVTIRMPKVMENNYEEK